MRKKLIGFVIGLAVLGLFAFIYFNFFEIVDYDAHFAPSREAIMNEYLALDRWLICEGHHIRVENSGNLEALAATTEKNIFIQSELFNWNEAVIDWLDVWIEDGGSLILSLNYYREWNISTPLGAFLDGLGLESFDPEDGPYGAYNWDSNAPSFARNLVFAEPEDAVLILKDENDYIRLVEFQKGEGRIIITGRPLFMRSVTMETEANARLCWYLFANAGDDTSGIFFIRGEKQPEGIMGRFFERGDFSSIIIASLALIIIGFWTAIPVFGVVKNSEEKKGKALAERFLAEGRFLRNFNSLDIYCTSYKREIKRRLIKKDKLSYDEIIGNTDECSRMGKKDFLKSIITLKTILECI